MVECRPEELKAELRGDAVAVELAAAATESEVRRAVGRVEGWRDMTLSSLVMHAPAQRGATAVPAILAALDGARRQGRVGEDHAAVAR